MEWEGISVKKKRNTKKTGVTVTVIGAVVSFIIVPVLQHFISVNKDIAFSLNGLQIMLLALGFPCFVVGLAVLLYNMKQQPVLQPLPPGSSAQTQNMPRSPYAKLRKWLVTFATVSVLMTVSVKS